MNDENALDHQAHESVVFGAKCQYKKSEAQSVLLMFLSSKIQVVKCPRFTEPEIINNNPSSAAVTATQASPSASILKPLSVPLPEKLNDDNFFTWHHSAIFTISGQELQDHLDQQKIPTRYASAADEKAQNETKTYKEWRLDDYNVSSWLYSSLDPSFKHRVLGCIFAHDIWSRLHTHFASQTKARIRQLQLQLKSIKKIGPASDYLLQIKKVVDALAAVGAPLTDAEYTNVILDGLNEDYHSFLTYVTAKDPPYSIPNLEALLMAQEDIVGRFKKPEPSMVQVNFTQSQPSTQTNFDYAYARNTPPTPNRCTYGRRGRGGRTNRGGRGSWNSNRPQCQICGKLGHIASYCYFRFDQQFQHAQQNSPTSSMHNALPPPP
nr:uncharacterized protein LOC114925294 [Arachis hypogaea]XP_029154457.1 uncharacterized protein LOC114927710 [Arachis hypogaea]